MRKYLAAMGVAGLIAVAAPSSALAGGAMATTLLPTADATDCTVTTPCESNGSGASATLKVRGANSISFLMNGMLPNRTYHGSVAGEGCTNIVTTFNSLFDGSASVVVTLLFAPDLGDAVEVCRQDEFGVMVPIYSGTLARLNG